MFFTFKDKSGNEVFINSDNITHVTTDRKSHKIYIRYAYSGDINYAGYDLGSSEAVDTFIKKFNEGLNSFNAS